MSLRDFIDLLALAALWGGSFLFMRIAAPEFGPIAMIEVRVVIASVFLVAVSALKGQLGSIRPLARRGLIVGALNSAIPFCLLAFASLTLTAGLTSMLNATTPIWGAIIAWLWLRDQPKAGQVVGLLVGLAGVFYLSHDKMTFSDGGGGWAILACLLATFSYGLAASHTKKYLGGFNPIAIATVSQLSAAILLLPLAAIGWPTQEISAKAWLATMVLGVASTGIAYILFFRLIARVGPAKTITVTYLIPVFGILWGHLFLDEVLTRAMLIGGGIVLLGTSLATGLFQPPGFKK